MKKLRSKRGFTLTEMLISFLLLAIVSGMVTMMTSVILNTTVTMREVAQAEILGSEALDNLQGQLRVAHGITVDADGKVTFDIDDANKGYNIAVDDEGKIVLVSGKEGEKKSEPLFAGVSYGNLRVSGLSFSVDDKKKTIKISVEISYGVKPLWSGDVTVKPLNGITMTSNG